MPVPKARGADGRADYVIVQRARLEDGEAFEEEEIRFGSTASVDHLLGSLNARQDGDHDDDDHHEEAPKFTLTTTVTQAQSTATALPNAEATETRPPGRQDMDRGSISKTTHHLLVAAGSIGATIIVVMLILAVYTMRKRGLTFREAVSHAKSKIARRGAPPTPPKPEAFDRKPSYSSEYGSMRNGSVVPVQPAMSATRSGSITSQRPLMALQPNESFNIKASARSVSPPTVSGTFLLDSPLGRNSHRRTVSDSPSSPTLPLQIPRRSQSTRNTRSISDESELKYPEPPFERTLSPLPPPPTFKQFLVNRPSVSARTAPNQMTSRFSWTNSNAPQTPHDPARDTGSHLIGRESFVTTRSSVPRFRTINSWVDQQANRIEEQKLREQYRMTTSTTVSSVPEVPELPQNVAEQLTPQKPATPRLPPPIAAGLPGKNIRHERQSTVDTAPIFRAHPGDQVRFSTRSAIASEVLDNYRHPDVLS